MADWISWVNAKLPHVTGADPDDGIGIDCLVMATKVRTPKNEDVNVPNSIVVSSAVINYSALQAGPGLILHTEVGIGFDTPWRQVEALLRRGAGVALNPDLHA